MPVPLHQKTNHSYGIHSLAAKVALSLLGCLLLPLSSPAAVILVIDISDPSQVTFTATDAHAQNNDTDSYLQEGISLIDFFQASVDDSAVYFFDTPSNLRSPGGTFAYTELTSLDFTGGTPFVYTDLSIFGSGFSTQDFSTSAPALTGSAVADLSAWVGFLPSAGTSGNIYSSDGISYSGPLIGQYTVVPEPTAATLLLCGGLFAWVRGGRRKSW